MLLLFFSYTNSAKLRMYSISNTGIENSLKILKLWYTLKVVKKRGILTNEFTKTDVTFIT